MLCRQHGRKRLRPGIAKAVSSHRTLKSSHRTRNFGVLRLDGAFPCRGATFFDTQQTRRKRASPRIAERASPGNRKSGVEPPHSKVEPRTPQLFPSESLHSVAETGLEQTSFPRDETPLSENRGTPGGTLPEDSASVASLRFQAGEQFEALWRTLPHWEYTAENPEAKAVQSLRGGLALLFRELEAITGDSN